MSSLASLSKFLFDIHFRTCINKLLFNFSTDSLPTWEFYICNLVIFTSNTSQLDYLTTTAHHPTLICSISFENSLSLMCVAQIILNIGPISIHLLRKTDDSFLNSLENVIISSSASGGSLFPVILYPVPASTLRFVWLELEQVFFMLL